MIGSEFVVGPGREFIQSRGKERDPGFKIQNPKSEVSIEIFLPRASSAAQIESTLTEMRAALLLLPFQNDAVIFNHTVYTYLGGGFVGPKRFGSPTSSSALGFTLPASGEFASVSGIALNFGPDQTIHLIMSKFRALFQRVYILDQGFGPQSYYGLNSAATRAVCFFDQQNLSVLGQSNGSEDPPSCAALVPQVLDVQSPASVSGRFILSGGFVMRPPLWTSAMISRILTPYDPPNHTLSTSGGVFRYFATSRLPIIDDTPSDLPFLWPSIDAFSPRPSCCNITPV